MANAGHDGWYNSGFVDPGGTLHTATYDPAGFGGRGVVYGAWDGASWDIEVAAPGSFDYAGGTEIEPRSTTRARTSSRTSPPMRRYSASRPISS